MTTTPTTTITNLSLRGETVVVSEERWPGLSIITVTPSVITFLTGRWLLTTQISTTPADTCAPPVYAQTDTTVVGSDDLTPPTGAMYVYRDLEARNTTVNIAVTVHKRSGAEWIQKNRALTTLTIPAAGAGTAQVKYGQAVHLAHSGTFQATRLRPYLDRMQEQGLDTVSTSTALTALFPTSTTPDTAARDAIDTFYADCASRSLSVVALLQVTCTEAVAPWLGGTAANPWPDDGHLDELDTMIDYYLNRWAPYAIQTSANEPNANQPAMSAARVVRVNNRMYDQAKITRPACKVLAGCLAFGDITFLEAMYTAGLSGHHDGISVHPYKCRFDLSPALIVDTPVRPFEYEPTGINQTLGLGQSDWLTAVTEIYKIMSDNGDAAKKVWITEGGWASCETATNGMRLDEAQQATFLRHGLRQLARCPYVEGISTYMAYDLSTDHSNWQNCFGQLYPDATKKPSWQVVKDTITAIKGGTG